MEVKEARNMMVEANSQEYAFNFLQQSLKNRIQDAEVCEQTQTHFYLNVTYRWPCGAKCHI